MLYLSYNTRGISGKVLLDDINYIKSDRRKLYICKVNGFIEFYESIRYALPWLDSRFYRSHFSLIVNFDNVNIFDTTDVHFLSGHSIHIGAHNLRLTKNAYKAYIQKIALEIMNRQENTRSIQIFN